jgi:hypothetical protein
VVGADRGRAAALDRLRAGRSLDRRFVADFDEECTGTVDQGGGDLEVALFGLHAGLYDAQPCAPSPTGTTPARRSAPHRSHPAHASFCYRRGHAADPEAEEQGNLLART